MTKKILGIALIAVLFIGVVAAAVLFLFPYEPKQPPKAADAGSTPQGIQEVVNANNKFAFDLYSKLIKSENLENENIFFSPYSISAAFAMVYEGAKGETADEINSVFHFPKKAILRPNFAAIYNNINEIANDFELRTGNALWIQQDFYLLKDYINRVKKYYGGKVAILDFVKETEKSRQTINSFIAEQTNHKIKDLIPQRVLGPMTRLVLTNAIYFKGTWKWEFDKADTREEYFKITPTNKVKTPMMNMSPDEAKFNYFSNDNLQILELPYKGEKISMLILLPRENLNTIEYNLTLEKLKEWKNKMEKTKLDAIYLPKFEFDSKHSLKNKLTALGMPTAFSERADFSGMTGEKDLFINSVIHQAYIKVDEKGTEAAAATVIDMWIVSPLPEPRTYFKANRPFIFLIQENDTGNILFLGRVVNPTK